jgi:hypothetical protein
MLKNVFPRLVQNVWGTSWKVWLVLQDSSTQCKSTLESWIVIVEALHIA